MAAQAAIHGNPFCTVALIIHKLARSLLSPAGPRIDHPRKLAWMAAYAAMTF